MMLYITVFVFGAVIGSFLNVCIYRIPKEKSVVTPSSSCPSCGTHIKFYDNIPILSYIILRGRCRSCKAEFSARYLFVEFINAALYLVVLNSFGIGSPLVLLTYFFFVSTLIVIFFIDIDHQIIPNSITFPGIPIALILGSTILPDPFLRENLLGFRDAGIGLLAGGGFFYLTAVSAKAILKKDAMGGGDIKMMAMVGGLLGWKGVILTTFMGSLLGSMIGVSLILTKGREWGSKIPFGPYLALGALVSLLWGENILTWYLS
ncbi:type 4 prepilin-like proteins leader peptide-processing enzyme [bacterium BMS3Abin09]|nr:type 4 prepilin-like proteins leader peptide-processing enzyme [bacterium BMS3Abin09]